jgi:hypothetical protein
MSFKTFHEKTEDFSVHRNKHVDGFWIRSHRKLALPIVYTNPEYQGLKIYCWAANVKWSEMSTKEDTKIFKNTPPVLSAFLRQAIALDKWTHTPFDRAWSALQNWIHEIINASRNRIERTKIQALIVVSDFVRSSVFRPGLRWDKSFHLNSSIRL